MTRSIIFLTFDGDNDGGSDERLDVESVRRWRLRTAAHHHGRAPRADVQGVGPRVVIHQVIQADGVVPELGPKVGRGGVAGLDHHLGLLLLLLLSSIRLLVAGVILLEDEVEEVNLLQDVVDSHAMEHLTIHAGHPRFLL